jgi:hypothetical protein
VRQCLDPEAFATLMGEERAAMVFTDPPYNVPIEGHASGLGAIHHRPFAMASGEMDKAAFTAFLGRACRNLATFSAGKDFAELPSPNCCLGPSGLRRGTLPPDRGRHPCPQRGGSTQR